MHTNYKYPGNVFGLDLKEETIIINGEMQHKKELLPAIQWW